MQTNQSIGVAIEAAKEGKRIAREGWNGPRMFVFVQVPATIGSEIIPKMQSLPALVKAEFARREVPQIQYMNQFALVKPDNTIHGWAPSSADTLATDWVVLD